MFKKIAGLIVIFLCIGSALFSAEKTKVSVAIAANLSPAMAEIKKNFEIKNPSIELEVISGSSGKLTTQILNGAPFEVFASADTSYPEKIKAAGKADGDPQVYAEGVLILFSATQTISSSDLNILKSKKIKTIAIANPETAPYGRAAVEAMKKAGVYDNVKSKLVYAENITQAMQYALASADVAFCAKSSVFEPSLKNKYVSGKNFFDVDHSLYSSLSQSVVILKQKGKNKAVKVFYNYFISDESRQVFKKYGYLVK